MKNKMNMLLITSLFLFPSSFALAAGSHSHVMDDSTSNLNESSTENEPFDGGDVIVEGNFKEEQSEEMSHDEHNMTPEEHDNMMEEIEGAAHGEHGTEEDHSSNEVDSSAHNETNTEGEHGHGGGGIEETSPNYTVLSVFGAINFSFLFVGLWKKRMRKKVDINVDAGKKD